ncbi:GNAT family N-acetyltransferase [Pikeienuella piscinae]|uniref:GNAT family N-acetyltransferase n=1 Tax=Pikeienuella piscinae TaxID=2748098 RepID=A0A7L5BX38_9RHOB|nr:GNAT family N-acetyltransferase [Pikeienuella piscinae]QIE55398.1 GNAT family N-acetyltransferase [Pikeienuella piscinae]
MPEALRAEAARLFFQGFAPMLGPALGRDARAESFLARVIRPAYGVAALDEAGGLLGLAGFQDGTGGLFGGETDDFWTIYGPGALWRAPLFQLFARPVGPGRFLLDGIVVRADARGHGIGAALIERVAALARERGARELLLDVALGNDRARALYERRGFRVVGMRGGVLASVFLGPPRAAVMARAV